MSEPLNPDQVEKKFDELVYGIGQLVVTCRRLFTSVVDAVAVEREACAHRADAEADICDLNGCDGVVGEALRKFAHKLRAYRDPDEGGEK